MDESLSTWYRANSRVYVASDHACWADPKLEAKVKRKRFGTVIRSSETGLGAMMRRHASEVQEFIGSRCVLGGAASGTSGDSTEDDNNNVGGASGSGSRAA